MAEKVKDISVVEGGSNASTVTGSPEEGSVDIYGGLELGEDQSGDDLDWSAYAQRLGIEADSFESIQSHYTSLQDSQVSFADEQMASTVQSMLQIQRDGGDWRNYANQVSELAQIQGQHKTVSDTLSNVKSVRATSSLEDKKVFLKYYFAKHLNMPADQIKSEIEALEELGDAAMNSAVSRSSLAAERDLTNELSQINSKLEQAKGAEANASKSAREKRELFERALDQSISQFQDPHGEQFTKAGQRYVNSLARSESVSVTIPKKIAEALLGFGEKGVDLNKLVTNLANMHNNSKRLPYLEKLAKENLHKSIKGVTPDVKPTEKGGQPKSKKPTTGSGGARSHMFHKR